MDNNNNDDDDNGRRILSGPVRTWVRVPDESCAERNFHDFVDGSDDENKRNGKCRSWEEF